MGQLGKGGIVAESPAKNEKTKSYYRAGIRPVKNFPFHGNFPETRYVPFIAVSVELI